MEQEKTALKNFIFLNDSQDEKMWSYFGKQKEIQEYLKTKRTKAKNSAITYRLLNHWEDLGLIDSDRVDGKGWRKFSILDIVWMEILQTLRSFGFPNKKILIAREHILRGSETDLISDSMHLSYYTALVLFQKQAVFALVFDNGQIEFATVQEAANSFSIGSIGNHIRINLNELIQKFYKKDIKPTDSGLWLLSEEEIEIIMQIRRGGKKNINLKVHNRKVEQIDSEEIFGKDININELIQSETSHTIHIKKNKGKIVKATKTTSKKYKD